MVLARVLLFRDTAMRFHINFSVSGSLVGLGPNVRKEEGAAVRHRTVLAKDAAISATAVSLVGAGCLGSGERRTGSGSRR